MILTKTLWFQHKILTLSIVICLALVTSFNKSWISTLQTFQRCKFSHMFAKRQELHAVAQPAFQDVVAHHADLREQQTMWPSGGSSGVRPGSDGHLRIEVHGATLTVGEPMNETSNATTNPNKTGKGNAYHLSCSFDLLSRGVNLDMKCPYLQSLVHLHTPQMLGQLQSVGRLGLQLWGAMLGNFILNSINQRWQLCLDVCSLDAPGVFGQTKLKEQAEKANVCSRLTLP